MGGVFAPFLGDMSCMLNVVFMLLPLIQYQGDSPSMSRGVWPALNLKGSSFSTRCVGFLAASFWISRHFLQLLFQQRATARSPNANLRPSACKIFVDIASSFCTHGTEPGKLTTSQQASLLLEGWGHVRERFFSCGSCLGRFSNWWFWRPCHLSCVFRLTKTIVGHDKRGVDHSSSVPSHPWWHWPTAGSHFLVWLGFWITYIFKKLRRQKPHTVTQGCHTFFVVSP